MILASIRLLRIHIHGRDAEKPRRSTGQRDLRAPVFRAVDGDGGAPAFVIVDALSDEGGDGFVEGGCGPVGGVEAGFEGGAGSAVVGGSG